MFIRRTTIRFGFTLLVILAISMFILALNHHEVAAVSNCVTGSPPSGAYTYTVCFSAPGENSTVSGAVFVTVTVSIAGTNPGIQRGVFYLDGNYLLTDYTSPYTFNLPTSNWVDGAHTLGFEALLRDGFTTHRSLMGVIFFNGIFTPPVNTNHFTPSPGTTPPNNQPLVVAAVGDGASGDINSADVVNLINSWSPNLLLYLGDVYEKGMVAEYYNWYGNSSLLWDKFRAITNPTIGNHEYENGVAPGYFNYWDNIPNYYSYTIGSWHFISLNANSQFNQTAPGTVQYQWLTNDLATNQATCTLVYWHQPVYNIGPEPAALSMQSIWSLLVENGIDIVLNGHDHDYQRWQPLDALGQVNQNGITEFIVGTGGHGLQTFVNSDSRVAASFDRTTTPAPYGALRLKLFSTHATYDFINTSGSILDTGTIPCHKANGGGNPTPVPTPTKTATPIFTRTPSPTRTPTPTGAPTPTSQVNPTPTANPAGGTPFKSLLPIIENNH